MERILREFRERYGENRAIAALAVIVEDESTGKKRVIHDAGHGVRVNRRIKCRDKIRAPGASEKKMLLREMRAKKKTAFSVVGATSTRPRSTASWAARWMRRRRQGEPLFGPQQEVPVRITRRFQQAPDEPKGLPLRHIRHLGIVWMLL
ncbi:unnamed protein product [Symbiodinium natans]|uniref:Uncharacterized protein n=1 Tax=Symbiodinium natans TaxID=878477 RepID=A0A812R252_9DINO|nr:unnamed protein product [Symbiodinium natans]